MKINTVVFDPGGLSGHVALMRNATVNSLNLAKFSEWQLILKSIEKARDASLQGDPDYCHYVWPGTIVLPQFYEAMTTTCEFYKTDFAYCECGLVRPNPDVIKKPTEANFGISQIMIKAWVIRELGGGHITNLIKRVMNEYRGAHVPHVLTMEISQ